MVAGCISKLITTTTLKISSSYSKVHTHKETLISSHLKVGVSAVASNMKAFASHNGNTSHCELNAASKEHCKSGFDTDYGHGTMYFYINYSNFFRLANWSNEINFYKQQELQMTDLKRKTKKL